MDNKTQTNTVDVWKLKNPGKETPKLSSQRVLDEDGKFVVKEGVWEHAGDKGVHQFEKYADAAVKTTTTHDDGTCVLSPDQLSCKHDTLSKSLVDFKVVAFHLYVILSLLEQRNKHTFHAFIARTTKQTHISCLTTKRCSLLMTWLILP